jgi:hypothetical protein
VGLVEVGWAAVVAASEEYRKREGYNRLSLSSQWSEEILTFPATSSRRQMEVCLLSKDSLSQNLIPVAVDPGSAFSMSQPNQGAKVLLMGRAGATTSGQV